MSKTKNFFSFLKTLKTGAENDETSEEIFLFWLTSGSEVARRVTTDAGRREFVEVTTRSARELIISLMFKQSSSKGY
jgi:hypothetical protein